MVLRTVIHGDHTHASQLRSAFSAPAKTSMAFSDVLIGETRGCLFGGEQDSRKSLLPLLQRDAAQVVAVQVEQVEDVMENAVSRYKAILGVSLSARTVKNQKVEAAIKCAVLNRMAELGMPRSERVY